MLDGFSEGTLSTTKALNNTYGAWPLSKMKQVHGEVMDS